MNSLPFPNPNLRKLNTREWSGNYIPRKTPKYSNYEEWLQVYYLHIQNILDRIRNVVQEHYPDINIGMDDAQLVNKFVGLTYQTSSRSIVESLI